MHKKLILWLKKFPILFIFSILFFEFGTILLIFQLKIASRVINDVIFFNHSFEQLSNFLLLILFLIIFRGVFQFSGEVLIKKITQKIKSFLRKKLSYSLFENTQVRNIHSGSIISIFYDRVEAIEDYYSLYIPQVILSILIPVSILFFVFPMDLLSGLVFFVSAPLIPFFMFLIGKFSEKINQRQWRSLSKLTTFFLDSIRGLKTILIFNQRDEHIERIRRANNDYQQKSMAVLQITFLSAFILELVSTLSIAIVAVEIGLRLLYFKISFEQAFFILLIAPEFYLPLRNLGLRFHAAMNGVEAYQEIHSLITQPERINDLKNLPYDEKHVQILRVENLSLQYLNQTRPIIEKFSFDFEKGKHYAIVGANGTGKSTFFRSLLRLSNPLRGKILIDGININDLDRKIYYSHIAWLPQDPAIFNGSFLENLIIANMETDQNEIENILEIVGINDFIDTFPTKYHTEIQEFGKTISSGQRQRIGLARLLLRKPSIILCDEPTAFLDPISEELISKRLECFRKERISITIAHRLHTVKQADSLLFFQKDKPVLTGSFDGLIAENESFRNFIKFYFGEYLND